MVKIRYAELPAGLHVAVGSHGRSTIIYLLPGLTPAERRAALATARSNARMANGPKLAASAVAVAVARDRFSINARHGVNAVRAHPMLALPPLIVLALGVVVFLLMSSWTLTFRAQGQPEAAGTAAMQIGGARLSNGGRSARQGGATSRAGASSRPGSSGGVVFSAHRRGPSGSDPSPGPGPSGSQRSSPVTPTPGPSTDPTVSWSLSPTSPSVPPSQNPSPSPWPWRILFGPPGICQHP